MNEQELHNQPTDITKDIRGNAEAKPWEVKRKRSALEERKIMRAYLEDGCLLPGHKNIKNKKYGRRDINEIDLLALTFIAKFEYCTTRTLSRLLNVKDASKRINGLKEWGYVNYPTNTLGLRVWMLTGKGETLLKEHGLIDFKVSRAKKEISLARIAHTLGVSAVASQILVSPNNHYQKYQKSFEPQKALNMLISEREMEESLKSLSGLDQSSENRNRVFKNEFKKDELSAAAYHTLTPLGKLHRPDFALCVNGKDFIAMEFELTLKNNKELEDIIQSYGRSYSKYLGAMYVCRDKRVYNKVRGFVKKYNLGKRVLVKYISDDEGVRFTDATYKM